MIKQKENQETTVLRLKSKMTRTLINETRKTVFACKIQNKGNKYCHRGLNVAIGRKVAANLEMKMYHIPKGLWTIANQIRK